MRPTFTPELGSPRLAATAAAVLLGALAAAGPAQAVPAVTGEFALTDAPKQMTLGPDGNVWVTTGGTNDLAKITPDGTVTEYNPVDVTNPIGIAAGPDGKLYVTQSGGVSRFTPADPVGTAENFGIAAISDPRGITAGPDGAMWAASGDKLVRIPTAAPATATNQTITGMGARGITRGGDGNLWIADFGGSRLVQATTAGATTFYALPSAPQEVGAGPGTQMLAAVPSNTVSRVSPGGTALDTTMTGSDPFGITLGNDGAYWVARFATNDVARVASDGTFTALAGISPASGPRYITRGAGDTIWVGLETTKKVARISGVEAPPVVTPPVTPTPTPPSTTTTTPPGTTPAGDLVKPVLDKVSITSTITRGRRLPGLTTSTKGSQLRLTLSEAATLRVTFQKATAGRKVGTTCARRTRANARRKPCVRYVAVPGSFSVRAAAGSARIRFEGRLTAKKALSVGRYRAVITATDAAGNSTVVRRATFSLLSS